MRKNKEPYKFGGLTEDSIKSKDSFRVQQEQPDFISLKIFLISANMITRSPAVRHCQRVRMEKSPILDRYIILPQT